MPSTVGAGTALPLERIATCAFELVIWVIVRLSGSFPARNSVTVPLTLTRSPTTAVGDAFVKTKTASEVAGSASGVGSWIQTPRPPAVRRAVTMPSTPFTLWPSLGEMCAAPWTSAIVEGAARVVKLNTWSAAIVSGGSLAS